MLIDPKQILDAIGRFINDSRWTGDRNPCIGGPLDGTFIEQPSQHTTSFLAPTGISVNGVSTLTRYSLGRLTATLDRGEQTMRFWFHDGDE